MYGRVTPWGFPVVAECSGEAEDSGGGFVIAFDFARTGRGICVQAESPGHSGASYIHGNGGPDRAPRAAGIASCETAQRSRRVAPSAGGDDEELARVGWGGEFARGDLRGECEEEKEEEAHGRD